MSIISKNIKLRVRDTLKCSLGNLVIKTLNTCRNIKSACLFDQDYCDSTFIGVHPTTSGTILKLTEGSMYDTDIRNTQHINNSAQTEAGCSYHLAFYHYDLIIGDLLGTYVYVSQQQEENISHIAMINKLSLIVIGTDKKLIIFRLNNQDQHSMIEYVDTKSITNIDNDITFIITNDDSLFVGFERSAEIKQIHISFDKDDNIILRTHILLEVEGPLTRYEYTFSFNQRYMLEFQRIRKNGDIVYVKFYDLSRKHYVCMTYIDLGVMMAMELINTKSSTKPIFYGVTYAIDKFIAYEIELMDGSIIIRELDSKLQGITDIYGVSDDNYLIYVVQNESRYQTYCISIDTIEKELIFDGERLIHI